MDDKLQIPPGFDSIVYFKFCCDSSKTFQLLRNESVRLMRRDGIIAQWGAKAGILDKNANNSVT